MKHLAISLFISVALCALSLPAAASTDGVELWTSVSITTDSGWEVQVSTADHSKRIASFRAFYEGHEIAIPQDLFDQVPYPTLEKIRVMRSDDGFYMLVPGVIFDAQGNGTKATLLSLFFKDGLFSKSSIETVPAEYLDGL